MEGDQYIRHILPAAHRLHDRRGSTLPPCTILPERTGDIEMVLESIPRGGLHLHFDPRRFDNIVLIASCLRVDTL